MSIVITNDDLFVEVIHINSSSSDPLLFSLSSGEPPWFTLFPDDAAGSPPRAPGPIPITVPGRKTKHPRLPLNVRSWDSFQFDDQLLSTFPMMDHSDIALYRTMFFSGRTPRTKPMKVLPADIYSVPIQGASESPTGLAQLRVDSGTLVNAWRIYHAATFFEQAIGAVLLGVKEVQLNANNAKAWGRRQYS